MTFSPCRHYIHLSARLYVEPHYFLSNLLIQLLEQLKSPRNLLLEDLRRIVFLARRLQLGLIRRAVPGDGVLPLGRVVQILPVVQEAHALRKRIPLPEQTLRLRADGRVVAGEEPRDGDEDEDVVAVARVEAEGVAAALGGEAGDDARDGLVAEAVSQAENAFDGLEDRVGDVVDLREESGVVSVGGGGEELPGGHNQSAQYPSGSLGRGSLPAPTRSAFRQFCRKAGDRRDPHRLKELRLDVREVRQSGREGLWLGVFEVVCNHPP
jgi:hypothetical protein